jgi:hypothetical protein
MRRVLIPNEVAEQIDNLEDRSAVAKVETFATAMRSSKYLSTSGKLSGRDKIFMHDLNPNYKLFYTLENDNQGNECVVLIDIAETKQIKQPRGLFKRYGRNKKRYKNV